MQQQAFDLTPKNLPPGPRCSWPKGVDRSREWHHFAWWYDDIYTLPDGKVLNWPGRQMTWPFVIEDWL